MPPHLSDLLYLQLGIGCVFALTAVKENDLCLGMIRSNMVGRDFGAYGVYVVFFFFF